MRILKNTLLVLATGYIFVYFSEHLFWARIRPDDSLQNWISAWIAYSLAAFIFLTLVSKFRIAERWPLFLAASAFGWLTEGLIVQTTYESLPLSISFTGLAWHALISVWMGWYAVRKALTAPPSLRTLVLFAAIGAGYALWGICWWLEPDGGVATLGEFSAFTLTISALVMVAYTLANWSASEPFAPNRWVTGIIAAVFVLYFAFVTVPAAPIALLILPLLLGLVYFGLHRNHQVETREPLTTSLHGRIHPLNYLAFSALPLTAIIVYATAEALHLQWQTNWILYLITTPLGFILFGIALVKGMRASL